MNGMGRTALVTGGTGGLGCAVTERLLDDGWRVVAPWIVKSELTRVPPTSATRARGGRPVRPAGRRRRGRDRCGSIRMPL